SEDLSPADRWQHKINQALGGSRLLLVLCSPASLRKASWISFETGFACGREVPVIPILHSGLAVGNLPSFLSEFQSLSLEAEDFGERLFQVVGKKLVIKCPEL